jgi:hypothetical protein
VERHNCVCGLLFEPSLCCKGCFLWCVKFRELCEGPTAAEVAAVAAVCTQADWLLQCVMQLCAKQAAAQLPVQQW